MSILGREARLEAITYEHSWVEAGLEVVTYEHSESSGQAGDCML